MLFVGRAAVLTLAAMCLLTPVVVGAAEDDDWAPVSAEELSPLTRRVDSSADAEILFRDVHIEDRLGRSGPATEVWNYVRIKLYTERGCESQNTVVLPYGPGTTIDDIAGRTIRPDRRIVRLQSEDIFERTLLQSGSKRVAAKAFVLPGVTPGAIIEYHWHEVHKGRLSAYRPLDFQSELPIRQVRYHIMLPSMRGQLVPITTRLFPKADTLLLDRDDEGYQVVSFYNLPGADDEPWMPPWSETQQWMLFSYGVKSLESDGMRDLGLNLARQERGRLKVSAALRKTARGVLQGARSVDDTLSCLYRFCQNEIRNASVEDRFDDWSDDATATQTLRRKAGTGTSINRLFVAMARAVGLDAHLAVVGDRGTFHPKTQRINASFLGDRIAAVRIGGSWRFFDPGSRPVPKGMLHWSNEGAIAVVAAPGEPPVLETPQSPASRSEVKRTLSGRVSEDGSLDADVELVYTGHLSVFEKQSHPGESLAEWERALKDELRGQLGVAFLTNIRVECPQDGTEPCAYRFHLHVPGWAQSNGRELLLRPSVFHALRPLEFSASARKQPVHLPYAWSERDSLTFALPKGFVLDGIEPRANFPLASCGEFDSQVTRSAASDSLTLIRTRRLAVSSVSPNDYPQLKDAFDRMQVFDNRLVAVKRRPLDAP